MSENKVADCIDMSVIADLIDEMILAEPESTISFHPNINQTYPYDTCNRSAGDIHLMHSVIKSNNCDLISIHLSDKSDYVNVEDSKGNTPLHYCKSLLAAQKLCEAGAVVNVANDDCETPLHKFAKFDCPTLMNYLLSRGAWPNVRDVAGSTALHKCCLFQQLENIRVLLYYGASTTDTMDFYLKTPLMLAVEQKDQAIMQELWPYLDKWEINRRSGNGYSLLMYLLKTGSMKEWILKLLEMEPNVNFIGEDGMSALSLSTIMNDAECFKIIWSICKRRTILNFDLHTFLRNCNFRRTEFLEVLYLMLDSQYGLDLVRNLNETIRQIDSCLLHLLINTFHNLQYQDCVKVLYLFLSYNVEIKVDDFWAIIDSNVIKPDLKQILLPIITDFCHNLPLLNAECIDYSKPSIVPVMQHLLGYFECNLNFALVKSIIIIGISLQVTKRHVWLLDDLKNIQQILRHARPSFELREAFKTYIVPVIITNKLYEEGMQILAQDTVPSLLEITRDAIRTEIQKKCPNPYCDIYYLKHSVDKLLLPQLLKDIVMFRKAIYDD